MEKKELNKIKISLAINILTIIFTIFASILMFTGFKIMPSEDFPLETTKIGMFRFFTVDSNIFVAIASLLFVINEIQILRGKKAEINKTYYILKLMATTAVGLTFITVFLYLGPAYPSGILPFIQNANLFFHLLTPLISIINFVLFERTDKLSFKFSFFGIIPTVLYEVYYLINVLLHMENGSISIKYDWYGFLHFGVWTMVIVAPLMILISYVISLIIWKLNRKASLS